MSKGYERLKRWREKHRGLANRRQRDYRTGKGVGVPIKVETVLPPKSKIEELRGLMAAESAKPAAVETVVPPPQAVYWDDYGRVITEAQWNQLRQRKEDADRDGYVIDEFSQ